ncbi:hypothetical protein WJX84_006367 [Apatococcus fuscideae]|uniref:Uncharacterized protein n=1 Tax=Apatococcus fuscideae TaxID=2026836 RepID=A0AAW1TJ61_9CHLO
MKTLRVELERLAAAKESLVIQLEELVKQPETTTSNTVSQGVLSQSLKFMTALSGKVIVRSWKMHHKRLQLPSHQPQTVFPHLYHACNKAAIEFKHPGI